MVWCLFLFPLTNGSAALDVKNYRYQTSLFLLQNRFILELTIESFRDFLVFTLRRYSSIG
jgi:hypothetical protein